MRHITVGRKYNEGKVAKIECTQNDRLQNTHIKGKCFLLIILTADRPEFKSENERFCYASYFVYGFSFRKNEWML